MNLLIENLDKIKSRINMQQSYQVVIPNEIKLLLATKNVSTQNIITAIEAGEILIGENKIQDEWKGKPIAISNLSASGFRGTQKLRKYSFLM
jgi:uncharacterized pyridoxal phosphate-containing UPF0001 family protein